MNAQTQKQKEAIERNNKWAALSFQEQLDHLDKLFGKDKGGTKQRAKIQRKIADILLDNDTKTKRKRTHKKK